MPQTDILVFLNISISTIIGLGLVNGELLFSNLSRFINFFKVNYFYLLNVIFLKQKNFFLIRLISNLHIFKTINNNIKKHVHINSNKSTLLTSELESVDEDEPIIELEGI